jgi:hypothetical protein
MTPGPSIETGFFISAWSAAEIKNLRRQNPMHHKDTKVKMFTEEKAFGQLPLHLPETTSRLLTVKQFALAHPAFTEPALRNLIFKADARSSSRGEIAGNGLFKSGAIIRIGRRILIDEQVFFAWVRGNIAMSGQGTGVCASAPQSEASRHG